MNDNTILRIEIDKKKDVTGWRWRVMLSNTQNEQYIVFSQLAEGTLPIDTPLDYWQGVLDLILEGQPVKGDIEI